MCMPSQPDMHAQPPISCCGEYGMGWIQYRIAEMNRNGYYIGIEIP